MNTPIRLALLTLACGAAPAAAAAQAAGLPTAQPTLVTIIQEEVKVGRAADHAKIEAGWPAAFGKANSPDYYLAMVSLTGEPRAWYIIPSASNAAYGEQMARYDKDAAMTAELARLSRADAEVLDGTRTVQALARTDLSMGAFPDLAKQRFWEISVFRVRPGHDSDFETAAKAYIAAAQRASPSAQFRTYQVIAGMPQPTFIIFSSVAGYGEFDQMMQSDTKTMQAFTPDEMSKMQKFFTDAVISHETNRFRLDPKQSYVSRETRATDPAFWGTIPAAKPAAQPPVKRP